jgi:hypothetical protein
MGVSSAPTLLAVSDRGWSTNTESNAIVNRIIVFIVFFGQNNWKSENKSCAMTLVFGALDKDLQKIRPADIRRGLQCSVLIDFVDERSIYVLDEFLFISRVLIDLRCKVDYLCA